MKSKPVIARINIEDIFFFLISPFLAIPLVLKGITEKKDASVYMLVFLLGLISFLYIPSLSNDKAQYYIYYQDFKLLDWQNFALFLSDNPDVVFYLLIFVFAQLNIPLEFFFLLTTCITAGIWFSFFLKFNFKRYVPGSLYFWLIIGVLSSISLSSLFSGVRFFLGIAFVLMGFYKIFIERKAISGGFILLLAVFTHFSCLVYIPFILILKVLPTHKFLYKAFFILSFIFVLVPKDFFISLLPFLESSEVIKSRGDAYIGGEEDFLANNLASGNTNNYILFFVSTLWISVGFTYILLTFKQTNLIRNFLLIIFGVSNVFYQFPTIFNRYILVAQILLLINVYLDYKRATISKKIVLFFIGLYSVAFLLNVYSMRKQLYSSLVDVHSITLITTLLKDPLNVSNFLSD